MDLNQQSEEDTSFPSSSLTTIFSTTQKPEIQDPMSFGPESSILPARGCAHLLINAWKQGGLLSNRASDCMLISSGEYDSKTSNCLPILL